MDETRRALISYLMKHRTPLTCPYCGSVNVKQFGGCTQEDCFFDCLECGMLSDYAVDYSCWGKGKTYLKKKNCQSNQEREKKNVIRNKD